MPTPEAPIQGVPRRRFLQASAGAAGAIFGIALVGCGESQKKSVVTPPPVPTPGCHDYVPQPTTVPERSQFQIARDKTLTPEQLAAFNVTVFNFSTYNGEIRFTPAFTDLIDPIKKRGGRLRIIWVNDAPNDAELSEKPLSRLSSMTDEELLKYRDDINKNRPNEVEIKPAYSDPNDNCTIHQDYIIHSTGAENGGFIECQYVQNHESDGKIPQITAVIGIKDPQKGYGDLNTDFYRTIPKNPVLDTILNRFFHEMKHGLDFATLYRDNNDSKIGKDFDKNLPHDQRPGELRAIYFAEVSVDMEKRGQIPPIVIYAPNGDIL